MFSALSADHFHNEEAAYAFVEARLWPNGPACPFCGAAKDYVGKLAGKSTRIGLYKCYACRKPFTVKIGTVMESSHVPMRYWLQAIYLFCSSKKGFSTRQLQRTLGCGLKTAWFLGHRIREAMKEMGIDVSGPLGGAGKIVEADETCIGGRKRISTAPGDIAAAVALVSKLSLPWSNAAAGHAQFTFQTSLERPCVQSLRHISSTPPSL
jgi:transposase-like protein